MWWVKLIFFVIGISSAEEHIYGVTCGKVPESRIMYGEKADLTKIGYQVYFQVGLPNTDPSMPPSYSMCGGSIIGKKHILTAAHCTVNISLAHSKIISGDETLIQGQTYKISKVHDHPDYDPKLSMEISSGDISILELETEIQFNNKVYPVCLPPSDFCLKSGQNLLVSGWGITEDMVTSSDLLQVEVELLSYCRGGEHNDDTKICAGGTKLNDADNHATDSCGGDSGGPLSYFDGNGVATLYGAVSYGPAACATEGDPGIYVRISEYLDWIREVSGIFMKGENCVEKKSCGDNVNRLGWTDGSGDSCDADNGGSGDNGESGADSPPPDVTTEMPTTESTTTEVESNDGSGGDGSSGDESGEDGSSSGSDEDNSTDEKPQIHFVDSNGFWHPLDFPEFCVRAGKPKQGTRLFMTECKKTGLPERKYKNFIWETID